jgi:hypothetical protein
MAGWTPMMKHEHKPFCITASLLTPMVIQKSSVNLAGLLYHCCLMHTGDQLEATSLLNELLKMTDNVHHASNMAFGVQMSSPLIALHYKLTGNMRQESDLSKRLISPNGIKGKYKKVIMTGGVYKARLDSYKAHYSGLIHFYGNGDGLKIKRLLNHYVAAIGTFAHRGAGSVSEFTLEHLKQDNSHYRERPDGHMELMRKLPISFDGVEHLSPCYEVQESRMTPPFYSGEEISAFIPHPIILTKHK